MNNVIYVDFKNKPAKEKQTTTGVDRLKANTLVWFERQKKFAEDRQKNNNRAHRNAKNRW